MTTIDFTKALADAKGASFEALPVGDYDIEVAKSEAVVSQNGKPMIKVTMKVISGPYEKRPIVNNFVLSIENAQAVAIFFRHMKAFGITEEFFASLGSNGNLDAVANALIGRRARLTLGHREWQGENRNEVKGVKPYTGAPPMAGPAGPSGPVTGGFIPGPGSGPTAGPLPPVPTPVPAPQPTPAPAAPPTPVQQPAPVAAAPVVQSTPQPPAAEVSAPLPDAAAPMAAPPAPPALPF